MAGRKKLDPVSEAAMDMVKMERQRELQAKQEQEERERRIAECHEAIGRFQGFQLLAKFGDVTKLVWLKDVKDSKVYRDLPNVGTWENFCKYLGLDRHTVDQDMLNLAAFGEEFLVTATNLRVGYRDLRKLRQLTHDGAVVIDAEAVEIDGERIPLDADHRDDLQAALERVIETNAKIIADKDATIKAKDKVLKDKQVLIERQAKELSKLEDQAALAEMTPIEEAFLRKLNTHRATFDGVISFLSPDAAPLTEDATPRMRAAYLETLGFMRRMIEATHDTAVGCYSTSAADDDGWVPPFQRGTDTEE